MMQFTPLPGTGSGGEAYNDGPLKARVEATEGKGAANEAATKKVADDLEAHAQATAETFEATDKRLDDLETITGDGETALGGRIAVEKARVDRLSETTGSHTNRISNVEDNLASGGQVLLKAMRLTGSVTNLSIAANAPAGATHYEVVLVGGGASGISSSIAANAHGGLPGAKRQTGRRNIGTEMIDVLLGGGGASVWVQRGSSGTFQNAGSDTVLYIRDGGVEVGRLIAEGGIDINSVYPVNMTPALMAAIMGSPTVPLAGQAITFARRGTSYRLGDAQVAYDRPGAGGGNCWNSAAGSQEAGRGGTVRYTPGLSTHGLIAAAGGLGSYYQGGAGFTYRPAGHGTNPLPLTPGTWGSGGGGGVQNSSANNGNDNPDEGAAGDGGFPGGGGGGGYFARAGAGADGAYDILFYGLAGQT